MRVVAQLGILGGLEWGVRWWIGGILGEGRGLSSFVGSSSGGIGRGKTVEWDWNGYLPCCKVGKGVPWLCGVVWIGAVVGAGHACAMAVSGNGVIDLFTLDCFYETNRLTQQLLYHSVIFANSYPNGEDHSVSNPIHRNNHKNPLTY